MNCFDVRYTLDVFQQLLSVDSTTGQYQAIQEKAAELIRSLGLAPSFTQHGRHPERLPGRRIISVLLCR